MKSPQEYAATGNEYAHQVALFMWANMAASFGLQAAGLPDSYKRAGYAAWIRANRTTPDQVPELAWLFAIKNAEKGGAIRGGLAKAEGVKSGVPDLCLPVPQIEHLPQTTIIKHGLYIELKRPGSDSKAKGRASDAQDNWQGFLAVNGYRVDICFGWEAARDCLLQYLGRADG